MVVELPDLGIRVEPASYAEIQIPGTASYNPNEDNPISVEEWKQLLERKSPVYALYCWHENMRFGLSHRSNPINLFDTGIVEKQGKEFEVVKKEEYGYLDRPVLKRGKRFERCADHVGKSISIQYAVDSEEDPSTITDQLPYDLSTEEIQSLRSLLRESEAGWIINTNPDSEFDRTPISTSTQLNGMLYYMYRRNGRGGYFPLYIGMSEKLGRDNNSLNWNFANITRDSIFGRWGYGEFQHLGELSRAVFTDAYNSDPKPKYERWRDEIFRDGTRVLRTPVYIEMVPHFDRDVAEAEEIMIRIAAEIFNHPQISELDHQLLNVEYT